jgi:predicted 2-oxoglutarate/Fe(II)-dependent dioxygenase YbiX
MRNLRLEAGPLVLFSSWALHEVKPFEGAGDHIAFNCWFNLADAA